ncbi:uncharacterized protein LOC132752133 isoform X2 [Ruditapes philippinarum]|uniref:uncharacterized protein LOC132752133 isoform X2 n=1 Tax=Ruditapes philippinarum TaxID=129788 RepID=UPI00295AAC55|nr:uncharacterized protein LOC132752133 isoform X2 [Ruditapes philippinarum]
MRKDSQNLLCIKKMRPGRKKPEDVAAECIEAGEDLKDFVIEHIPPKGRGVRTTVTRRKGDFLMIYPGELLTEEEGEEREVKKPSVYRYFFNYRSRGWCVDATSELDVGPRLGRLVNHGRKDRNCVMKTLEFNKRPYLCLFAVKDIPQGEELLYDYGIKDIPWERKTVTEHRVEAQATDTHENIFEVLNTATQIRQEAQTTDNSQDKLEAQTTENLEMMLEIQTTHNLQDISEAQTTENLEVMLMTQTTDDLQDISEAQTTENLEVMLKTQTTDDLQDILEARTTDDVEVVLKTQTTDNLQDISEAQTAESLVVMLKTQTTDNLQDILEAQTTDKVEVVLKTQTTDNLQDISEAQSTENLEVLLKTQTTDDLQDISEAQSTENLEVLLKTQTTDDLQDISEAQSTENLEVLLKTQTTDDLQDISEAQSTENLEVLLKTQTTDDLQDISEAQTSHSLGNMLETLTTDNLQDILEAQTTDNVEVMLKTQTTHNLQDISEAQSTENLEVLLKTQTTDNIQDILEAQTSHSLGNMLETLTTDTLENRLDAEILFSLEDMMEAKTTDNLEKMLVTKTKDSLEKMLENQATDTPENMLETMTTDNLKNMVEADTKDTHMRKMAVQPSSLKSIQAAAEELIKQTNDLQDYCVKDCSQGTNKFLNDLQHLSCELKHLSNRLVNQKSGMVSSLAPEKRENLDNLNMNPLNQPIDSSAELMQIEDKPFLSNATSLHIRQDNTDSGLDVEMGESEEYMLKVTNDSVVNISSKSFQKRQVAVVDPSWKTPENKFGHDLVDPPSDDESIVLSSGSSYVPSGQSGEETDESEDDDASVIIPEIHTNKRSWNTSQRVTAGEDTGYDEPPRKQKSLSVLGPSTSGEIDATSKNSIDEHHLKTWKKSSFKNVNVEHYQSIDGKRNYSKKAYCYYCKNLYKSKISKHIFAVHAAETRVRKISKMELRSKERKAELQKLKNEGNFNHNVEVNKLYQ